MQSMIHFLQQNMMVGFSMTVLLALSALFSGTETALFSLTAENARRLRSHRTVGYLIEVLHRSPSDLLSAILFGNLIVNILFFCTGAVAAGHWGARYGAWGETLGGILILFSVILFGEIIPKAVGVSHPAAMLRLTGSPLAVWFRFSRPVHFLIDFVLRLFRLGGRHPVAEAGLTSDELKELLDAVRHEPGFGVREKVILEDIVNLPDIRVREIMVPRVQLFSKPCSAPVGEILSEAAAGEFSHVLVYRDQGDDDLLGFVKVRDLFFSRGQKALDSLIHPLAFVPETKRADQLLKEMLDGGRPLTAVVDEYGGLAGMVTLEDLFAEVIGDLEPEQDAVLQLDENTYRLDGQLPIREWKELLTGILPGQEVQALAFDTLGVFIISLLGRMPRRGDSVFVRNLALTVETMQHRRIQTVLLHLNSPEVNP
jgi:putative hemolysin